MCLGLSEILFLLQFIPAAKYLDRVNLVLVQVYQIAV